MPITHTQFMDIKQSTKSKSKSLTRPKKLDYRNVLSIGEVINLFSI